MIRAQVPHHAVEKLGLDPLVPIPSTVVDEAPADNPSDLLVSVFLGRRRAFVNVLPAHKSYSDCWVSLQLAEDIRRVWEESHVHTRIYATAWPRNIEVSLTIGNYCPQLGRL